MLNEILIHDIINASKDGKLLDYHTLMCLKVLVKHCKMIDFTTIDDVYEMLHDLTDDPQLVARFTNRPIHLQLKPKTYNGR